MSNELDKHIGETLGRYESSVDAEALWQAVKPPKKRKPWLWFLLLASVITVAGGLWTWSAMKEQDQVVEDAPAMVDHTLLSTETDTVLSTLESGEEVAAIQRQQPTISDPTSTPVETKNTKQFSPATYMTKAAEEKEITTDGITVADKLSTRYQEPKEVEIDQAIADLSIADNKMIVNSSEQSEEAAMLWSPIENPLLETDTRKERSFVLTPAIKTLVFGVEHVGKNNELIMAIPATSAYRRSKNSPFFAQIDVAYFGLQRELESKDSLAGDWASDRTNSEELLEGVSADLSFGYRSQRGWQVRGGLGYTQINTLFGNTVTTQTVDSVEGLQVLIYNADNSVDSIMGQIAYYETTTRLKQTYNSIRQWELPILAGYNFELGRLTLLAEAGVRLQLDRSWEGTVLNQDLESNFQDLSTTDWYRTGLGVSLQGGLQLAYPITSKIDILAGGSVRYNLQDFSSDASPFVERYQLLGGQLGLRYRF